MEDTIELNVKMSIVNRFANRIIAAYTRKLNDINKSISVFIKRTIKFGNNETVLISVEIYDNKQLTKV